MAAPKSTLTDEERRAKRNAISRAWCAANPEKVKAAQKKYREANGEAVKEKQRVAQRERYAANSEAILAKARLRALKNPEKTKAILKRRADKVRAAQIAAATVAHDADKFERIEAMMKLNRAKQSGELE